MEITKTLLINAACLLIPPVVVVLLLRHFFPREIRWSAGVVALVDLWSSGQIFLIMRAFG